jgi:hypothetical protein
VWKIVRLRFTLVVVVVARWSKILFVIFITFVLLLMTEIQFGSHVHMLPMPKNYISKCHKIQTNFFTCTSS